MVEQQRQRLEHEITNLVDDLDKSYLRNMQVSQIIYKIIIISFPNGISLSRATCHKFEIFYDVLRNSPFLFQF